MSIKKMNGVLKRCKLYENETLMEWLQGCLIWGLLLHHFYVMIS